MGMPMLPRRKDRVPKGKMKYETIKRQIEENITAEHATLILTSLVDTLWGPESDQEWGADTLGAIANLLHESGLGPDCL